MEALDQSPAPARVRDSLATATRSFYFYGRPEQFAAYAATTQRRLDQHPALLSGRAHARWRAVEQRHQAMGERAATWRYYCPALRWHGETNQYHQWLVGLWTQDGGHSLVKRRKTIGTYLRADLPRTLSYALPAMVIVLLGGTLLGVWAAQRPYSRRDQVLGVVTFGLNAIPTFWLGTVLLWLLSDPEMGVQLLYFEGAIGQRGPEATRYLLMLGLTVYASTAVLSRLMRNRLVELGAADFMRTAQAKGLTLAQALARHGLRFGLILVATLLGSSLPVLVSGSLALEVIFHWGGMGETILRAVNQADAPVLMAVYALVGSLTLLGYLISDLLYAWLDPRIVLPEKY